jgi:hypothetical protein
MQGSRSARDKPSPLSPALHLADAIKLKSHHQKKPGELTNKTQKSAFHLLQQEEKSAVRSRLECLLVQQFLKRFGSKHPNSPINDTIRKKVKDFVNSFEDVRRAEASIGVLDFEIQESIGLLREELAATRARAKKEKQVPVLEINNAVNANNSQDPDIDRNQWPVINAIISAQDEIKQQREQEELRKKKLRYQEQLNQQIERNKELKERRKEQTQSELQVVQTNLSSYEAEVERTKQRIEEKHRQEREMREAQIEENKRLKEQERRERINIEKAQMARAARIAAEEEEDKRLMKLEQKRNQEKLKIENEHNQELKNQALKERQEYEKKLNADYE